MKELDLNIGSQVLCTDGDCGKLAKYAVNADEWRVTHLIVEDGMVLKKGRVFPFSAVEWATSNEIQLSVHGESLAKYPEYREEVIEKPAPEDGNGAAAASVIPYGHGHSAAPPVATVREKVRFGVAEGLAVVEQGTVINGREGKVGKLDHFLVDAVNGAITRVIVQQGLLFAKKRSIPVFMTDSLSERAIFVAATEEALKEMAEYEPKEGGAQEMSQSERQPDTGTDDAEMDRATRVATALFEDVRTSDAVIEVIDDRGVITLQGEIDDPETRDAAEAIAAEQLGVISVVNSLQIKQ